MTDDRRSEFVGALLADTRFNLQEKGAYLRGGPCPNCGKNELFVSKAQPFRLTCGRENNCGLSWTIKALYPHLFENWEKRHPATKANPKATADAYLTEDRGFAMLHCRSYYDQETYPLKNGEAVPTARFYLDKERTRYWERLIGKTKEDGQKANIGGRRKQDKSLFKGDAWCPPDLKITAGDKIYITEGIFHAIALKHAGKKAVAAISSGNFAGNFIKQHAGAEITWILAYDGDKAGRKYMPKHAGLIRGMGEEVRIALLEDNGLDWDDLWQKKALTDSFFTECFYQGDLFSAKNVEEKAFITLRRHTKTRFNKSKTVLTSCLSPVSSIFLNNKSTPCINNPTCRQLNCAVNK